MHQNLSERCGLRNIGEMKLFVLSLRTEMGVIEGDDVGVRYKMWPNLQ